MSNIKQKANKSYCKCKKKKNRKLLWKRYRDSLNSSAFVIQSRVGQELRLCIFGFRCWFFFFFLNLSQFETLCLTDFCWIKGTDQAPKQVLSAQKWCSQPGWTGLGDSHSWGCQLHTAGAELLVHQGARGSHKILSGTTFPRAAEVLFAWPRLCAWKLSADVQVSVALGLWLPQAAMYCPGIWLVASAEPQALSLLLCKPSRCQLTGLSQCVVSSVSGWRLMNLSHCAFSLCGERFKLLKFLYVLKYQEAEFCKIYQFHNSSAFWCIGSPSAKQKQEGFACKS